VVAYKIKYINAGGSIGYSIAAWRLKTKVCKTFGLHVTLQCRPKSFSTCHLSAAVRRYILLVSCECVPF
jgi:hypothetical protein